MQRFHTNQASNLPYLLAEAGLTDEEITNSSRKNPQRLVASDIDVTCHQGLPAIHFCRSQWSMDGRKRREIKQHDRLTFHPLVRLACDLPETDTRYTCFVDVFFDDTHAAAVLLITEFSKPSSIPGSMNMRLDDGVFVEQTLDYAAASEQTTEELQVEAVCSP